MLKKIEYKGQTLEIRVSLHHFAERRLEGKLTAWISCVIGGEIKFQEEINQRDLKNEIDKFIEKCKNLVDYKTPDAKQILLDLGFVQE